MIGRGTLRPIAGVGAPPADLAVRPADRSGEARDRSGTLRVRSSPSPTGRVVTGSSAEQVSRLAARHGPAALVVGIGGAADSLACAAYALLPAMNQAVRRGRAWSSTPLAASRWSSCWSCCRRTGRTPGSCSAPVCPVAPLPRRCGGRRRLRAAASVGHGDREPARQRCRRVAHRLPRSVHHGLHLRRCGAGPRRVGAAAGRVARRQSERRAGARPRVRSVPGRVRPLVVARCSRRVRGSAAAAGRTPS